MFKSYYLTELFNFRRKEAQKTQIKRLRCFKIFYDSRDFLVLPVIFVMFVVLITF